MKTCIIVTLLLVCPLQAQTSLKAQAKLVDGSIVNVALPADFLTVATKYGKLSVPLSEIRQVEFGLHVSSEVDARIKAAVADLSSPSFKSREEASKILVHHGPHSYATVIVATKNGDAETAKRAEAVARRIEAANVRLVTKEEDVVHADGWPVVGRVQELELKASSPLLGELTLKVSDMQTLTVLGEPEVEVVVEAAKDWMETKTHLAAGSTLAITTAGEVNTYPAQAGYTVKAGGLAATMGKGGIFPTGALIGKVGAGVPFLVGESYTGKPGEGRLFLYVEPSPWNNVSSGGYKAKVRVEYR